MAISFDSLPNLSMLVLLCILLICLQNEAESFSDPLVMNHHHPFTKRSSSFVENTNRSSRSSMNMNIFSDIGDALSGGKLIPQTELPYNPPFCPIHSISTNNNEPATFAIQERGISFTGEDFDIYCPERNSPIVRVRGAMLHLPGKDKMRIDSEGDEVIVLDRVLMAVSPTYDIYRGGMNAEKVGWIEKKVIALTETFDVYMEGKGGFGPFKPPPAYELSGDFLERSFVMKNDKGEAVAKFSQDGIFQFDSFNHYQVQVAPGMDALLVLACACAIDEEIEEELKERKKKREEEAEGKGGWF